MTTNKESRVLIENTVVFGADLLHPTMLEIIRYVLRTSKTPSMQAIFITDEYIDKESVAKYCHATRSMCISLMELGAMVVEEASMDDIGFSLTARIWTGFIYCLWHEIHHNRSLDLANCEITPEWTEEEERKADEFATEAVEETILVNRFEMPATKDFPGIEKIMEFLVSELREDPDNAGWVAIQKKRLDDGIVFENNEMIHDSIVEYFLATCDHPELYEDENPGAEMTMTAETEQELPSLFDQRILPGQQGELFGKKKEPVSLPTSEAASTPEGETINMTKGDDNVYMGDDIHDHMPDEAFGGNNENENDSAPSGDNDNPFDITFNNPPAPETPVAAPAPEFQKPLETGLRDIIMGFWARLNTALSENISTVKLTDTEKAVGVILSSRNGIEVIDAKKAGCVVKCHMVHGTVPAFDIMLKWKGINRRFKLIKQNPAKNSKYAERARNGEKIAWLLEHLADGGTGWRGVFENGVYRTLEGK